MKSRLTRLAHRVASTAALLPSLAGNAAMDQTETPDSLFRHASRLQRANKMEAAIRAYASLLRKYPEHVRGLNRLGNCLLAVGKVREANMLFERASSLQPDSAVSHYNLGRTLDQLGDSKHAREALVTAVRLQPDLAIAWLQLGRVLDSSGQPELALGCYQLAFDNSAELETLPKRQGVPTPLAEMVTGARRALRGKYMALHRQAMQKLAGDFGKNALARVQACLDIQHGIRVPEHTDPLQKPESIYFPGLTARPWFDRSSFAWLADFESHWTQIRGEFLALSSAETSFKPYVGDGPDVPDSMQNLAGSHDWDAFHLYAGGKVIAEHAEQCPETARLLNSLPLARLAGLAPEAFFSLLRPGAHIQPHHGISNAKLAVHLPLIVPENCFIRVGDETRGWTEGKCQVFDDSFEHEAWNQGEQVRVVLIFEVWHPDLDDAETTALTMLSGCIESWAAETKASLPASL